MLRCGKHPSASMVFAVSMMEPSTVLYSFANALGSVTEQGCAIWQVTALRPGFLPWHEWLFCLSQSVEEDLESASGQNYQQEFLRCLREVNVDNNTVGWYQSSTLGAYQTQEMIETFISYHDSIKKCVCMVYDPQRSQRGQVCLKAIRLKDSFIDLFKEQKLTGMLIGR